MVHSSDIVFASGQLSSLAYLLYDICITFDDEVNLIWSKPRSCWIKWQFLFIRYFALAVQLTNRSIEAVITAQLTTLAAPLKAWYICQVLICSLLLTAVETVLMARVYALYNKNQWVGIGFMTLLIGEIITVAVGMIATFPDGKFHQDSFIESSPDSFAYFGIAATVSQLSILILTWARYLTAVKEGWAKQPIMTLMIRDGTIAFSCIFIITIFTIFSAEMSSHYSPLGTSWFISIVAVAGSRLVINLQRLPIMTRTTTPDTDGYHATIELTTVIPESNIYPSTFASSVNVAC